MLLQPFVSENQRGGYTTSFNLIKYVPLRSREERLSLVRILLESKEISINNLSTHLQKLVNSVSASGALLVLMAEKDLPILSIDEVRKCPFQDSMNENRLLSGRVVESDNSVCYPLIVLEHVIGYLKVDFSDMEWPVTFNKIIGTYADIITRELVLDLKLIQLKKEESQLESKIRRYRHWQDRSRKMLNMITHDLKSPLLSVSGYLHLLGTKFKAVYNDARVLHYYKKIETGLDDMSEVVGQINDLLVYVNDSIKITKVEVDLNWMVKEVLEMMEPLAHNKKINLSYSPSYEPAYVDVDIVKTKRIIYNLVSNSIKYTPAEGNIQVMINADEQEVLLMIKDDGYGIEREKMDEIFQSYYRGVEEDDAEWSSAGLGLSISNMFARILGGRISVDSTPGLGSTFTFHLPVAGG